MTRTPAKKKLSSSLEDYLEAILKLEQSRRVARTKDIARVLGVNMSSVTGAMKGLALKGLVNHDPYSFVTLTGKGKAIAGEITMRHKALTSFFVKVLGISPKLADENACRVEHAAGPELIERLVRFLKFLDECPLGDEGMMEGFRYYCKYGRVRKDCRSRISKCRVGKKA
ncbi:MAG: metal-dependent transcriptional regulator [Planctomycetota bacterium]